MKRQLAAGVLAVAAILGVTDAAAKPCVNVNTASAVQLDTLPRVGAKTAAKILAARKVKRFVSLDDLARRVRGIGPKTVAKWKGGKLVCKLR